MANDFKEGFNLFTIVWFLLLIAPFSYCNDSCNSWGMMFVAMVMLIAAIPVGVVDIFFSVAGYPLLSPFQFKAALAVSYVMVFSMAWILGFITNTYWETLNNKFLISIRNMK